MTCSTVMAAIATAFSRFPLMIPLSLFLPRYCLTSFKSRSVVPSSYCQIPLSRKPCRS